MERVGRVEVGELPEAEPESLVDELIAEAAGIREARAQL